MPAMVDRARRRLGRLRRTGRWTGRGVVASTVGGASLILAAALMTRGYGVAHLDLYRAAVGSWLTGDGLYAYRSAADRLGFPLTPAAAAALLPVALLPTVLGDWLLTLASVAALGLTLVALVGPLARRYGLPRWPAVGIVAAAVAAIEPVRAAIGLGDLDLLILGLVTADVVALRRGAWARSRATWWPIAAAGRTGRTASRSARTLGETLRRGWARGAWAGVGTGLAAALAVSPVIFIGYLAVTRQWRAAGTATATAVTVAAAAFLVAPGQTGAWITDVLWRTDRAGPVDATANQSLAGLLARLYDSPTTPVLLWLSFAALLLAVGLIRAKAAHADGDELAAVTLVGLTGAAVSPVTDTHELVWLIPALLILADAAARRHTARPWVTPLGPRTTRARDPRRRARLAAAGYAAATVAVYLLFVAAPVWWYEHRLPATSHQADGALGVLGESSFALAVIVLVTALPWRPGVPGRPPGRWAPAVRRPIPPARRPQRSEA